MSDTKIPFKKEKPRDEESLHEPSEVMEKTEEEIESVTTEVEKMRMQLEEAEGKYKRVLADFQNLERQTQEAQNRFIRLATQGFVEEIVEPFDHLKLAAGHIKDKGLEMVVNQFRQVFESQGLKEINPVDELFDPQRMEAIDTQEGEEGKVLRVEVSGYELNGIVIRPAKVTVGKKSE